MAETHPSLTCPRCGAETAVLAGLGDTAYGVCVDDDCDWMEQDPCAPQRCLIAGGGEDPCED